MYVGAASQHVLRMSFVPEQEVQNLDRQINTFWSRLIHRAIASPLFLPLKLGGLGVGSAVQRHAAAPWRTWQSIIPTLMATTQSPDTDSPFSSTPLLRAQLTQLQSTIPTNEQTLLPAQTTRSSSTPPNHPKRNKSPPSKGTSTNNFTTASLTHPLNRPSSFHNPLDTLVRTSCSQEVKHMRLRIVAFVSQLPED